jgi:hypothetical protein
MRTIQQVEKGLTQADLSRGVELRKAHFQTERGIKHWISGEN